ncbi:MAG: hypothetical protein CMK36_09505 [Porticoccaceae bacterium]|nr:hypothetical protein [Porticoccaceae bacterium]
MTGNWQEDLKPLKRGGEGLVNQAGMYGYKSITRVKNYWLIGFELVFRFPLDCQGLRGNSSRMPFRFYYCVKT